MKRLQCEDTVKLPRRRDRKAMKFGRDDKGQQQAIFEQFTQSFPASEGDSEGKRIGNFPA